MGRYDVAVRGKERLWIILRDFRDDTEDLSDEKATLDLDLVDAAEHGRLYDGGRDAVSKMGNAAAAILIGQTGEWADPTCAAGADGARERDDTLGDGTVLDKDDGRASPDLRGMVARKFVVVETSELPNKVQVRFYDGAKEELDVDVADCSKWSVIAPQETRHAELEEIAKNIAVELVFAHYDDIGVDSQQPHTSYAALRWADRARNSAGAGGAALAQTPEQSAIEALQQSVAQLQRQVAGDVAARASLVAAAAVPDAVATAVADNVMGSPHSGSLALDGESPAAALALTADDADAPIAPPPAPPLTPRGASSFLPSSSSGTSLSGAAAAAAAALAAPARRPAMPHGAHLYLCPLHGRATNDGRSLSSPLAQLEDVYHHACQMEIRQRDKVAHAGSSMFQMLQMFNADPFDTNSVLTEEEVRDVIGRLASGRSVEEIVRGLGSCVKRRGAAVAAAAAAAAAALPGTAKAPTPAQQGSSDHFALAEEQIAAPLSVDELAAVERDVRAVDAEIDALVAKGTIKSRLSLARFGRRHPIRVLCAYQSHVELYGASHYGLQRVDERLIRLETKVLKCKRKLRAEEEKRQASYYEADELSKVAIHLWENTANRKVTMDDIFAECKPWRDDEDPAARARREALVRSYFKTQSSSTEFLNGADRDELGEDESAAGPRSALIQRGWFDLKTISNTLLLHPHPAAEAALDVGDRVDVMEHHAGRIVCWHPGRIAAPPGGGPLTVVLEGPIGDGARAPLSSLGSEARPLALIVDRDRSSVGSRLTVLESAPVFMAATHWTDGKHRVVVPPSLGALDVLASSQSGAPTPVTLVRKQRFHTLRISLNEVSPLRARVAGSESAGKVCRWQLVLFSRMVEQVVTQQFFRKKATMRVFLEKQLRHKEREPKEDAFPTPDIAKLARKGRESGWEDLLLEEKINLPDMLPVTTKEILDLSYIEKMQEQLNSIEEAWQAYRKGDAVDEGDWWRARLSGVCGTKCLDEKGPGAEIEMTVSNGLENNELMVKRLVAKHGWTHIKALGEIQHMRERLTGTETTEASGHLSLAWAMFKLGQLELQCDDLFHRAKATWNAQIEEEAVDTIGGHVKIEVSNPAGAQRDGGFRVSFVIEGDVSELCDRLDDFGVGHRFSEDFSSDIIVTALYGRIEEGLKPFQLWGDNNSFDFDAQVTGLVAESEAFVPMWRCCVRKDDREEVVCCRQGGAINRCLDFLTIGNESNLFCVSAEIHLAERAFHRKCVCKVCTKSISLCPTWSPQCTLGKCWHYTEMIIAAGALAGAGLAMDSSVVVVASMLVSPLMGPIIWMVFGTLFMYPELKAAVKTSSKSRSGWCGCCHFCPSSKSWLWVFFRGLVAELFGLVLCVVIGFICGMVFGLWSAELEWPTAEMTGRGKPEGLAVGAVVAIASGLGVAASIQEIQGATGALIGVAISASLLPPAVNSGMCWWMSLVVHLDSPYYDARSKTAKEYFDFAVYSLTLTLMNIALVWGTCVVFFALKKLAAKTTSKKLKNLLSDAPEEVLRSTTYGARRNGSLERGGELGVGGAHKSLRAEADELFTSPHKSHYTVRTVGRSAQARRRAPRGSIGY